MSGKLGRIVPKLIATVALAALLSTYKRYSVKLLYSIILLVGHMWLVIALYLLIAYQAP